VLEFAIHWSNNMSLAMRAVISLLSGIGAGAVGFWAVWTVLVGSPLGTPEPECTPLFLTAIFLLGLTATGFVFHRLSVAMRKPAEVTAGA
jgi:hypothetical protein